MKLDAVLPADTTSLTSFEQKLLATTIALRRYRQTRHHSRAAPQRQNAIDDSQVAALGLRLPTTPERHMDRKLSGLGGADSTGDQLATEEIVESPSQLDVSLVPDGDSGVPRASDSTPLASDHRHRSSPLSALTEMPALPEFLPTFHSSISLS